LSGFLYLTPTVQIVIENPLLRRIYPTHGLVSAVIDTGYQGFLSVPRTVFRELGLNELPIETRSLSLADGSFSKSKGCYARILIEHIGLRIDGFVESFKGLDEILMGVEALVNNRVILDYCTDKVRIDKCNG
jgi:clan AA aspartic protease